MGDKDGLKYVVACPKCKQETELTKTGVASLPTAFFKAHLTRVYVQLEKLEGKKEGTCEECSIITTESDLNSRKIGNPRIPIFMGCEYFHDIGPMATADVFMSGWN